MSLRLRLALFGGGVVALALLVFGVLLYALLSRSAFSNQDDALRARAQQAVRSLDSSPPLIPAAPVAPADLGTTTDVFLEVFGPGWSVQYTTVNPVVLPKGGITGFASEHGFRLYTTSFDNGYVVTGQTMRVPQSNLSGIVVFLIISALPALIAALLASWLVAGRALAPLKSVASAAEDVGRTRDFGRRLVLPSSRDEVARLAASFNGMLSRLQDAYESQRRFVADASHELRTPLTTIQGNAGLLRNRAVSDGTRDAALADISAESARMARLVDRLLTLARADSGLELGLAPVLFRRVVDEVCRQAAAMHTEVTLDVNTVDAVVNSDEDALRQLVWILLDNAFRHARSRIDVRLFVEPAWARLAVIDDGEGVAPAERERIFERFYRSDASRTGAHAGLGLAIAQWIVEQHHGRITAGAGGTGGAAFLVDIPLLPTS